MNRYQPGESKTDDGLTLYLIIDTDRDLILDDQWFYPQHRDDAMAELNKPVHTPEPWHAGNEFVPNKWQFPSLIAISASGEVVAHVNCGFGRGNANARLIAAAPELLAMLRALSTEAREWGAASNNCKVMREARALLAKVVGEK